MTLIELLVVFAIIAILASLILASLGKAKTNGKTAACLSNLRQFAVAGQLYCADNGSKLVENSEPGVYNPAIETTNSWVYGNMKEPPDATNATRIRNGELYPYLSQVSIYRCPSDNATANGSPRTRSYSENSWIGGAMMEYLEKGTAFRVFVKEADLAAVPPSRIWEVVDENVLTLQYGWFEVTMDNSAPFYHLPASRHNNGYCLNFADGHAETYHLVNPWNRVAETEAMALAQGEPGQVATNDVDWVKLRSVTTMP